LCYTYHDPEGRAYWYLSAKNELNKVYTYANWYLPAKNELNKMRAYANENNLIGKNCASKVGGVQCLIGSRDINDKSTEYRESNAYYWSSTEKVDNYIYWRDKESGVCYRGSAAPVEHSKYIKYDTGDILAWSRPIDNGKYDKTDGDYESKSHPFGVRAIRAFGSLTLDLVALLKMEEECQAKEQKLVAELAENQRLNKEEEQQVVEKELEQKVMEKLNQEIIRRKESAKDFDCCIRKDVDFIALQQMIGPPNDQLIDELKLVQQKVYSKDVIDLFHHIFW
jgi:hypothetical protein